MKFPVSLARFAVLACALALPAAARADIVVGQVAPLSGVLASTGRQMVVGARVAFDAVNHAGGVHGEKIRVRVADDGYDVEQTVRLTRDLVADPEVVALLGFAGTANITRLLHDGVLADAGIPLVAPYTGGEGLRTPYNPWIFHVRAGYADECEHMVRQLVSEGLTRISVLYQRDAFGESGLQGVRVALARRGLVPAGVASYERGTADVEDAARRLVPLQAQAVIMVALNKPAAAFLARYREIGGRGQVFGISVIDPGELVRLDGPEVVRGLGVSQVMPFPYLPLTPLVREFRGLMQRYAPDEPVNYTNFEEFVGAKVLVEALRRAGPRPARAAVLKALASIDDLDLGGFHVGFGGSNRLGSRFVDVVVVDGAGRPMR